MVRLVAPEPEPEEEPPPLLYGAADAARILGGISTNLLYRYVQSGDLHPVKLGARSMFSMEELERFIKAQALLPIKKRKKPVRKKKPAE